MFEFIKQGSCLTRVLFSPATTTKPDSGHELISLPFQALVALLDPNQRSALSGQAYFISDGNPVNNLLFFMDPLFPAIHGRDAAPPKTQIPFAIVLVLSWVAVMLSWLFGKAFSLPSWGLTPTEAYKVMRPHYLFILHKLTGRLTSFGEL